MNTTLAAVVLAAGLSRRMGRVKLALDWMGSPLLERALLAAAALDTAILVGGPEAVALPPGMTRVPAPAGKPAQSRSLAAGILALPAGVAGAVVLLGDMPLVTPGLVLELAGAFRPGRFLVPVHAGMRGNPVVIPREMFARALSLTGDTGARPLLAGTDAPVDYLEVDDPAVLTDVDTPEDYAALTGLARRMQDGATRRR
ncbi:MAG: nucleotidyltransferase family protein [Thermodesulfobacteriota bacterium]